MFQIFKGSVKNLNHLKTLTFWAHFNAAKKLKFTLFSSILAQNICFFFSPSCETIFYQIEEHQLDFKLFLQLVDPFEQFFGKILRVMNKMKRRKIEIVDRFRLFLLLVRLLDVLQHPFTLTGSLVHFIRQLQVIEC